MRAEVTQEVEGKRRRRRGTECNTAPEASVEVASEALELAGAASTVGGFIAGAATFSIVNAALVTAKDRKRCGECIPQPSEADAPGSGTSIALGTALDAVPETWILGISLHAGETNLALVMALAFSNLPEALSGTRLRLRGPRGAQFEFTLAAIAQNLRRLGKLIVRPPPLIARCSA
jgi:hypothetical protein